MFALYATLYRHALVRHDERNFQVRRCDTTISTSLKLSLLRRYSRDPIIVFFTINHKVIGQRLSQDDNDDEQSLIDIFRADLAPPVVHSVQNSNIASETSMRSWQPQNGDQRILTISHIQPRLLSKLLWYILIAVRSDLFPLLSTS
ncbi:hypothetical protein BASA50_004270 [Batrachochytrium salamandrivorans]|uniref:Uncharacterized protein n=1 Tax=Batrachochytrium salamandrivorans TaxID=1357716 RepID=A0ABQ8FIY5_9FUNG|nr:hypothetical protein BASA50_004270 [Batrachochytrium salamandrivorans]KAH9271780.1 hypothetical protein BASA83_005880 [Batrachochytrium salamandrivorans]